MRVITCIKIFAGSFASVSFAVCLAALVRGAVAAAEVEPQPAYSPPPAAAADSAPAPLPPERVPPKRVKIPYLRMVAAREELARALEEKNRGVQPTPCSEQTPGIVYRVNVPAADTCTTLFLTLDACTGGFDSTLVRYLIYRRVKATLFITARWIIENPQAMQLLARHEDLFELENHGTLHRPASVQGCSAYGVRGTDSYAELVAEVEVGADYVERHTGKRPLFFRSGTAFADNLAVEAIGEMGYRFAGYAVAADQGATLPRGMVAKKILEAQSGDIILMHFNSRREESAMGFILAYETLRQSGACVRFEKLADFAEQLVAY